MLSSVPLWPRRYQHNISIYCISIHTYIHTHLRIYEYASAVQSRICLGSNAQRDYEEPISNWSSREKTSSAGTSTRSTSDSNDTSGSNGRRSRPSVASALSQLPTVREKNLQRIISKDKPVNYLFRAMSSSSVLFFELRDLSQESKTSGPFRDSSLIPKEKSWLRNYLAWPFSPKFRGNRRQFPEGKHALRCIIFVFDSSAGYRSSQASTKLQRET